MPDITSNLVAWWKFDEGTGTTAQDSTINASNGTLTGTPPAWVTGKIPPSALDFNGSNDYVSIPANSSIGNLISSFTLAAWVSLDTLAAGPIYHAIWDTAENPDGTGFALKIRDTSGILEFTTKGVFDYVSATASLTAGVWTHLAVVLDASFDATFFVNGVQKDTIANASPGVANTTQATFIGASANNGATPSRYWWDGKIDDLRIYGRELSASDISFLYNYDGSLPKSDLTDFPKFLMRPDSLLRPAQGRLI